MPKWIHDRAKHLQEKNPEMSESQAWAIATQQSHALGKSPKSYGTVEGRRTAKAKFRTPKDDEKRADPEKTAMDEYNQVLWAAFSDELQKIADQRFMSNLEKARISPNSLMEGIQRAGFSSGSRATGYYPAGAQQAALNIQHPDIAVRATAKRTLRSAMQGATGHSDTLPQVPPKMVTAPDGSPRLAPRQFDSTAMLDRRINARGAASAAERPALVRSQLGSPPAHPLTPFVPQAANLPG